MPFSPSSPLSAGRLVTGSATFLLFALNTLVWCSLLYVVTLLKLVVPIPAFRRAASRLLVAIAEAWIAVNTACLRATQPTTYDVKGLEGLRRDVSYLVVSNHQSWVDIPVLQGVFLRRIPFLRRHPEYRCIYSDRRSTANAAETRPGSLTGGFRYGYIEVNIPKAFR